MRLEIKFNMQTSEISGDHLSSVQNTSLVDCCKGGLYTLRLQNPTQNAKKKPWQVKVSCWEGWLTRTHTHTQHVFFLGGQSFRTYTSESVPQFQWRIRWPPGRHKRMVVQGCTKWLNNRWLSSRYILVLVDLLATSWDLLRLKGR